MGVSKLDLTLLDKLLFIQDHTHSQSHQTTFAQIAADELGVPMENIDIVHGDTDKGTLVWELMDLDH